MFWIFPLNPTSGTKSLTLEINKITRCTTFTTDCASSVTVESRHIIEPTLEALVYQFDPIGVKCSYLPLLRVT